MKKPANNPVAATEPTAERAVSVQASLEQIRAEHLAARNDAHDTIARLERWRDEIDATIAFLKAQRR